MRYQRVEAPLKLDGLASAKSFFAGCLEGSNLSLESLWVAHVDDESRCLHISRHQGDESSADFPLRKIIAHNHPSGDARPSRSDCVSTRRLAAAAEALDCTILDHLVFGGRDCSSMRQLGYL